MVINSNGQYSSAVSKLFSNRPVSISVCIALKELVNVLPELGCMSYLFTTVWL